MAFEKFLDYRQQPEKTRQRVRGKNFLKLLSKVVKYAQGSWALSYTGCDHAIFKNLIFKFPVIPPKFTGVPEKKPEKKH
jgi:hypothetical protein